MMKNLSEMSDEELSGFLSMGLQAVKANFKEDNKEVTHNEAAKQEIISKVLAENGIVYIPQEELDLLLSNEFQPTP